MTVASCPHGHPGAEGPEEEVLGPAPGPKGGRLFGCLGELRNDPMRFSARVAQKFGGVARIPLGRRETYLVSEPALLRELLITKQDKYTKNVRYGHFQKLVGRGLLLSEGESWRAQRRVAHPAFRLDSLYEQVPWMSSATTGLLDEWESRVETGLPFEVGADFFDIARRLAGEWILGPHFGEIADEFCGYANDVKNAWPRAPRSVLATFRPPSLRLRMRFDRAVAGLDALTYALLERHRKHDFEDTGVVTLLARASKELGEPYTDEQLRDQVMTLFFAGHETSATALTWIHYLLSIHPEVRQRLEREVDQVVGGTSPTAEEIKSLTYTEQVVNESLRLYSPIHAISRVAIEDDTIGGHPIPKGATVVVSLFATHRLPQYWPDPERFDPERFSPEECARRPDFAFLPFAAGRRNCIGGGLAMIELKMIVAQLAQRYRLELVPGHPIELEPGTTMYPLHGMQMTLERRRAAV